MMQVTATVDGEEQVVCENSLMNSSWSLRPLRLHFARETTGKNEHSVEKSPKKVALSVK